jgi:hypothetical protein
VSDAGLAALGAFLSGAGSVLGAWFAMRSLRRRLERECRERVEVYERGIRVGRGLDDESVRPP